MNLFEARALSTGALFAAIGQAYFGSWIDGSPDRRSSKRQRSFSPCTGRCSCEGGSARNAPQLRGVKGRQNGHVGSQVENAQEVLRRRGAAARRCGMMKPCINAGRMNQIDFRTLPASAKSATHIAPVSGACTRPILQLEREREHRPDRYGREYLRISQTLCVFSVLKGSHISMPSDGDPFPCLLEQVSSLAAPPVRAQMRLTLSVQRR